MKRPAEDMLFEEKSMKKSINKWQYSTNINVNVRAELLMYFADLISYS